MATIEPMQVTTRDGRSVRLRTIHPDDALPFMALANAIAEDSGTLGMSGGELNYSEQQERDLIRGWIDDAHTLVLVAEHIGDDGVARLLGDCSVRPGPRRKMRHHVTLGMMIDRHWRGVGLGKIMLSRVLDWCAATPGIEHVRLQVYTSNTPAVRLYESLGFRQIGLSPQYFLHPDGTRHDDLTMALWVKPGLAPTGMATWRGDRAS
ncbi:MAG: GNAT family N-acetyltransferase [Phycisphaerales bacterium]|jgi:RimJ/RimL family protein N-acetyltransferase|nr:GNAT family N-acetyltransferase [Phycisphaerales bacterium]